MSSDFRRDDPLRPGEVEWIAPGLRRIICANPGPFTYRGTNTYLIGRGSVAVLDPGPDDPAHRAVILAALAGERVRGVPSWRVMFTPVTLEPERLIFETQALVRIVRLVRFSSPRRMGWM